jgi:hypothetical protein
VLNDVIAGAIGFGAVFGLSLMTGGFSFYQPWIIWSVIVLFSVGFFKGSPYEAIWPKVLTINSSWIVAAIFLAGHDWWLPPAAIAGTLLPTAAGVYLKRKFMKTPEP